MSLYYSEASSSSTFINVNLSEPKIVIYYFSPSPENTSECIVNSLGIFFPFGDLRFLLALLSNSLFLTLSCSSSLISSSKLLFLAIYRSTFEVWLISAINPLRLKSRPFSFLLLCFFLSLSFFLCLLIKSTDEAPPSPILIECKPDWWIPETYLLKSTPDIYLLRSPLGAIFNILFLDLPFFFWGKTAILLESNVDFSTFLFLSLFLNLF